MQNNKEWFEFLILADTVFPLTLDYKVLILIERYEVVSPNLIIEKLGIAKSNLALLSKKLEEKGLIQKTSSNCDKRAIFYALTDNGKAELDNKLASFKHLDFNESEIQVIKNLTAKLNKKI